MRCRVCGKHYGEPRRLAGGYLVRLCPDCANAWHDYIAQSPLWKAYIHAYARWITMVTSGEYDSARTDALAALEEQLYEEGRKWVYAQSYRSAEELEENPLEEGTSDGS